jgi:diaminohydroxyphosphoribosylaminopyrimidine deaminase / 5-amino-6-(5-phosphoribosylamino)uracil reductase
VQEFSSFKDQCLQLAEQFHFHIKNKRPFVSLKVATSIDGKMALESGESQWITGEEARLHSRKLRAHYDATIISIGTFIKDNPMLNFRGTKFANKKENRIIILDPKSMALENFEKSNIFKNYSSQNIYILTKKENRTLWSKHGVHVLDWQSTKESWDKIFSQLYEDGIASLFVEGGSFLYGQLLQFKLVNKFYHYQAPIIIGKGISWTKYFDNPQLSTSIPISFSKTIKIGKDKLNIGYINK